MAKNFSTTYLYSKHVEYEKKLFNFLMNGEVVDKKSQAFEDIRYEIKRRQISNFLVTVLDSENVILMLSPEPLQKAFCVMCAKDIKHDKKLKVFIDCTAIIKKENGVYKCTNIDILVAYLVNAMNSLIYYADEKRITSNGKLTEDGARCFASLFTHIVDYICKISIISNTKNKCLYLASVYYQVGILGKDYDNQGVASISRRISGLSEREEDIIRVQLTHDSFLNIKLFIDAVQDILKLPQLTLDILVEKWMYLFGTGTVFALELYPSFSAMLTDAYVGCYINNQKTIEKLTGRNMVEFTRCILTIGESTQ